VFDHDAQPLGIAPARNFKIELGFALEKVTNAAADMRGVAGDAQQLVAVVVGLRPRGSAFGSAMDDAMRNAAQW